MSARRIIDTELLMAHAVRTPGLLRIVQRWCRLNSIEPTDVPVPSDMVIEDSAYGLIIRHEIYLLNADGRQYVDPDQPDRAAMTTRTALLRIAPPTAQHRGRAAMTTPTLAPEPVASGDSTDDEIHVVCCIVDVALCGTDVAGQPWYSDEDEATCVVCRDLEGRPCERCGL
ncbi:hypothetical protein [Streptomyces sp. NPDC094468]|uniref:hypothetical protein n=1 Tax=Streptomyces sp. NPDC094468 TaxID=3366066 RepID=UPI0038297B5E